MLWKNATMLALASGLLVQSARLWLRRGQVHTEQQRRTDHVRAIQRWEDEGGSPGGANAPVTRRTRKRAATQAAEPQH